MINIPPFMMILIGFGIFGVIMGIYMASLGDKNESIMAKICGIITKIVGWGFLIGLYLFPMSLIADTLLPPTKSSCDEYNINITYNPHQQRNDYLLQNKERTLLLRGKILPDSQRGMLEKGGKINYSESKSKIWKRVAERFVGCKNEKM